jgi:hypothetical protein
LITDSATVSFRSGVRKKFVFNGRSVTEERVDNETLDSLICGGIGAARSQVGNVRSKNWFSGAWFLNPATNEYTFVPVDLFCNSPYGGLYSTMFRLPPRFHERRPQFGDRP